MKLRWIWERFRMEPVKNMAWTLIRTFEKKIYLTSRQVVRAFQRGTDGYGIGNDLKGTGSDLRELLDGTWEEC